MIERVPPSGHIIESIAAQNLDHHTALSEWIDNSLDAGATSVDVAFGPDYVRVTDNGRGCRNVRIFAQLGGSARHVSTKSGVYGIGSKDSALWYGGTGSTLEVVSVHGDRSRKIGVEWMRMVRNDWEIEAPVEGPANGSASGTTLVVSPLLRKVPSGSAFADLCKRLGYTYAPALNRGVKITVRQTPKSDPMSLVGWRLPTLVADTVIDKSIDVGGKTARIRVGLVDGVENERPGLTYWHGFRVIKRNGAAGCGDAPTSRICGVVQIGDEWKRTKNKDDLVLGDELYATIEREIAQLLERVQQEGRVLSHANLIAETEAMLNALVAPDSKEKRDPGNDEGTREPKNTGRRRKRASKSQPGSVLSRVAPYGQISVAFADFDPSEGAFRFAGRSCVELNTRTALIRSIRDTNNVTAAASWVLFAIGLEASGEDGGGQRRLRGIDPGSDLRATLAALCSREEQSIDGQQIASVHRLHTEAAE